MWSAILYSPYNTDTESIFALNGTYRKRIDGNNMFEWGLDTPSVLPTIAAKASGDLTGVYNAKYTYVRKERNTVVCESNPSLIAVAIAALSSEDLRVTYTEPDDPQVNCIRVYRTAAGGTTYYLDRDYNYACGDYGCTYQWEIDDEYISGLPYLWTTENTEDVTDDCYTWEIDHDERTVEDNQRRPTVRADNDNYIDCNNADGDLGTTAVHSTYDRPPLGTHIAGPSFNGTCFILKGKKLYYSLAKQPEYWPATYYVDVGSEQYPGKCMVFFDKQPFVLSKNKIFYIAGSSSSDFMPKEIAAKTGTQSQQGAVAVEGHGIFHIGADGVYLCLPSTTSMLGKDDKISLMLDPIFRGETVGGIPGAGDLSNSWIIHWQDKVYFGYPAVGDTYPKHIIVFYLSTRQVGYHTRGEEIHTVAMDNYNNRLLAGDENSYLWVIEDIGLTTDDGTAISWEVESKDFTLQTRRHFPRWAKYDADASDDSCTATGEVMLDGTSHQSHTLSGNRNTRRRLIEPGNGKRCSHKISGSGVVEIHMVESE